MTIHEAAEQLGGKSLSQMRQWLRNGRFPGATHIMVNGHCHWEIPEEAVKAFVPKPIGRPKEEPI